MATQQVVLSPGVSLPAAFKANFHSPNSERAPQLVSGKDSEEENGAVGSRTAPLLSSSLQQVEVMERLKQLMAWQERQKASLLRQQQEEIIRLHSQHLNTQQQLPQARQQQAVHQHLGKFREKGVWCVSLSIILF